MTMEPKADKKKYPVAASSYTLLEEVGQGASATVYRAKCIPLNEIVAIKVLDLERCNSNLDDIRREVQMMSLISHSNVLNSFCSFVVEHTLWVVMPYMAGGSCLHIMKTAYPDGFEEPVIATVLKECLKALEYLHRHGHIHRDVKAGNILVDAYGAVKLADFGVSACMFDTGDRQRSRNTFVGTPCWMAPEVLEQVHGYDFKADIWSFGITALELAHGHAPFSKYPPMKVLLMTLQNAPPGLDYERDKRFSKSFKEMIAMCLVKNPSKRPAAEKLLRHSFFKHARSPDCIVRTVLDGLAPLGQRFRDLKVKDAERLAQKKMPFDEKEERSQTEYKRGVSSWNFDVEDLRAQASSMQDDDGCFVGKEEQELMETSSEVQFSPSPSFSQSSSDEPHVPVTIHSLIAEIASDAGGPVTRVRSGPLPPAQMNIALPDSPKNYLHVHEDEDGLVLNDALNLQQQAGARGGVETSGQEERGRLGKNDRSSLRLEEKDTSARLNRLGRRASSGPLVPEHVLGACGFRDGDKDQNRLAAMTSDDGVRLRTSSKERAFSGPLYSHASPDHRFVNGIPYSSRQPPPGLKDCSDKGLIVQKKGRFSVTPADVELAESRASNMAARRNASLQALPQLLQYNLPPTSASDTIPCAGVLVCLQNLLQNTVTQQDLITKLINSIGQVEPLHDQCAGDSGGPKPSSHPEIVSDREHELLQQVADLQNRLTTLVDELQTLKLRNVNLERQLNAIYNKEEEERMRKEDEAKD